MTNPDLRRELRGFIEDNFLYLHPDLQLGDADSLLGLGVIDSLGFVELVEEVQSRYRVSVGDEEITEDNFGSIAAIARYVEARLASGEAAHSARNAE
jgi:acyl carrier protein